MEGCGDPQSAGGFRLREQIGQQMVVNRLDEPVTAADLVKALEGGELSLAYQPKVETESGRLMGVEALARWRDPDRGWIVPRTFVDLAERNGLIEELTDWGLRTALDDWTTWREGGLVTQLSFNISALSLGNLDFPDYVERLCNEKNVPTRYLTLELTESASQHWVALADTLTRFRIKGVGLALDDFGTGYSSLLQLRRLPFTELKLDRAFVADISRARDSRMIVKALIELAHAMGLSTTAEGVEDLEGLSILAALGCDQVQSNFVSPALAAQDVPLCIADLLGRATGRPL